MNRTNFFSSLGLLVVLNLLIKPVWIFLIDRQVQIETGTSAYGSYFSILGLSVFLSFLLDWGLTVYYNRQLASDPDHFSARTGGFILIKLLLAGMYTGAVFLVALFSGIENREILFGVILIQVLTSFFVFLRSIVTAKQWFRTDAWLSVLDKMLMIVVCGTFLYIPSLFGPISIQKFLYVQAACTAVAIVFVLIILVSRNISFALIKPFPGKSTIKATLPIAMVILLMSAHYRADGFLLERLHENGAYQAGVYAGVFRILDAANMIGFLAASFLLPYISGMLGKNLKIDKVVLQSRHLLMVFSLFVSCTALFMAPWLQLLLNHTTEPNAISVMQWCPPVLIAYSLVHVYATVLTAKGYMLPLSYILLASVALNILFNLLLIPKYGALGCCYSALISQSFCGLALMYYTTRKAGLDPGFRTGIMYLLICLLLCGFYYLCRWWEVNNWISLFSAGLLSIGISYLFKLFNWNLFKKDLMIGET